MRAFHVALVAAVLAAGAAAGGEASVFDVCVDRAWPGHVNCSHGVMLPDAVALLAEGVLHDEHAHEGHDDEEDEEEHVYAHPLVGNGWEKRKQKKGRKKPERCVKSKGRQKIMRRRRV